MAARTTIKIRHELKRAMTIMAYHLGYKNRDEYLLDLIKKDIYARSYELADMNKAEFNELIKTLDELPAILQREEMEKAKLREAKAIERRKKFERDYLVELRQTNKLMVKQGRKQKKPKIKFRVINVEAGDYIV